MTAGTVVKNHTRWVLREAEKLALEAQRLGWADSEGCGVLQGAIDGLDARDSALRQIAAAFLPRTEDPLDDLDAFAARVASLVKTGRQGQARADQAVEAAAAYNARWPAPTVAEINALAAAPPIAKFDIVVEARRVLESLPDSTAPSRESLPAGRECPTCEGSRPPNQSWQHSKGCPTAQQERLHTEALMALCVAAPRLRDLLSEALCTIEDLRSRDMGISRRACADAVREAFEHGDPESHDDGSQETRDDLRELVGEETLQAAWPWPSRT